MTMCMLPAGDIEIMGRGPGGRPLPVIVEYKKLPDLLQCERDGRFAQQLRRMRERYEVCWLLVEGEWRLTPAGNLEIRERGGWRERGRHSFQEVVAWLLTMVQAGGALLWHTRDQAETVQWLRTLYWWWTAKDLEEHRAHLAWYTPPFVPANPYDGEAPSVAQKVAAALLGTGPSVDVNMERAKASATHFKGSVASMLHAGEQEWRRVPGIGPKLARKVVEGLR